VLTVIGQATGGLMTTPTKAQLEAARDTRLTVPARTPSAVRTAVPACRHRLEQETETFAWPISSACTRCRCCGDGVADADRVRRPAAACVIAARPLFRLFAILLIRR